MPGHISIHAPRGGSDACNNRIFGDHVHFNPRSPWGERLQSIEKMQEAFKFQSTLPVGGATFNAGELIPFLCISIHAPRGGSDNLVGRFRNNRLISIHAPRGGSDNGNQIVSNVSCISIHAPRGGSDGWKAVPGQSPSLFQSTLPVGGATTTSGFVLPTKKNFNPRSPWGERP